MRDEGEIRQKLKQAQFRHLKRILRSRFKSKGDWPKDEVEAVKDEVKEFFQKAPIHKIAVDYPDVAALLWVLEARDSNPLLPGGALVGRMDGVPLWADTVGEASHARQIIDRLVIAATAASDHPDPDSDEVDAEDEGWEDPPDYFEAPPDYFEASPDDLEPLPPVKDGQEVKLSWWQRWFG